MTAQSKYTPDDMQASRCTYCGQQMRGTDWTDRILAERDALRAALQAVIDADDSMICIKIARAALLKAGS